MLDKTMTWIRRVLLSVAENVSLFVFTTFLVVGVLGMEPMVWYRTQIDLIYQNLVFPWGAALCLLRLERQNREPLRGKRYDVITLFVLLAWIIVPFAIRFGVTFNNAGAWYNHAVVYFGVYAFLSEQKDLRRERLFDQMLVLCCALAIVLGGALLYCAATVQTFTFGAKEFGFGLYKNAYLCHGMHYNITGMLAVCLAMLCLAGVTRGKFLWLRALYALGAGMMLTVIVLTQSRTARYAAIIALSVGVYGVIAGRAPVKKSAVRHAAAAGTAAVVLLASYFGAASLNSAALAHYTDVLRARTQAVMQTTPSVQTPNPAAHQTVQTQPVPNVQEAVPAAGAPATAAPATAVPTAAATAVPTPEPVELPQARAAVDSTLSGRTAIWKNVLRLWRDNPKHFLIGNGIGRTGSRVVKGTIHEAAGAVQLHNTYLQHTADFGLIGSALLAAFFAIILRPVLRVFFARGEKRRPGYTALCMLVIACLATGMMESAPLGGMTTMNVMLFYALALLAARGREMADL